MGKKIKENIQIPPEVFIVYQYWESKCTAGIRR